MPTFLSVRIILQELAPSSFLGLPGFIGPVPPPLLIRMQKYFIFQHTDLDTMISAPGAAVKPFLLKNKKFFSIPGRF